VVFAGVYSLLLAGLLGNMAGYRSGFDSARKIYDQPTVPCPNVTPAEDCQALANATCERHQGLGSVAFTWCGRADRP